MSHLARLLLLLTLTLLASSCASIIHGTADLVTISSSVPGATISVDGVPRGQNHVVIELARGKNHVLSVSKPGYQTVSIPTGDSFDPTTLLGILIDWGIITIPIDIVTGAMWKVSPVTYFLDPVPLESAPATPVASTEEPKKKPPAVWTGTNN